MLNRIISFSIKNKFIIGLFTIALIGYGSYQATLLPIDAVPDITDNQVQIITVAPSLGAPDVERLITFPIEQANSNIPGLKEIRSFSRFGLSLITVVFDDGVDVYWARQQVAERLKIAEQQIPEGIALPELAPVTTGLGEIYQYAVRTKPGYEGKYSLTDLRTIQDWIVRRQLLGVQGVADVSSFGGKLKQFEIAVDVYKLKAYNLSIGDVFNAVKGNNENTGGAYIEKNSTVLSIRSEGLLKNIEDIKKIVLKTTANGTPLLIQEVAEVKEGSANRYGAMTYNSEGEVAGAVVMMLKGGNSSDVIKSVKSRIAQIEKMLPEGVIIEPFLDRTKMVNNAISTVSKNLMEGALIVIFVLVLFLGNFRAGLLVASVIPLAMLFAVIMMNLFGVSGNLMSLGALDFGLIVDGAVIIVEAVLHSLFHHKKAATISQKEMDNRVQHSAGRMMNSAVFGQIIILIVYLPIFTLSGVEGKMFKPMAQTVAFALIGAFILSLTYIPMMSTVFLNKKSAGKMTFSDRMMLGLEKGYRKMLLKVLAYPKMVIATVLGLFLFSLFLLARMGGEFIPTLEEGDFAVETRVLTGSSIGTTAEACMKGAAILKNKFPEVEKVVGKIGSGEIPTDPMPMNAADMMVILKDKSEWTSASTFNELSEKMGKALEDLPGVTFGFQYPVQMRFNELMTGAKQDVVCKIFGENLDSLAEYSQKLGDLISKIDGARDIYVEPVTGLPQIIVRYKRNQLAQFGLSVSEVNKVLSSAFAGVNCGLLFEDEKRFDVVVRLAGEQRQQIENIQNLTIPTSKGTQIPLYQVADIAVEESVNQIQREDAKRRIIVGFNIRGRDVQSIVSELQKLADKQMKLPAGFYVTYGGSFENLIAAKKRLSFAVPLSLLLIFLLLFFAFGSVKHGLLIYTAIPLSAIGGILFLSARNMPFSISAGIGFIALFGVAVLNGIVLIAEFIRIKNDGVTNLKDVVLQGTILRLRPVLMTACVASFGFLPMALSHGSGAEVQRPLATVVIGGLLIATFLTLFVLPVLYVLFENLNFSRKKIKPAVVAILVIFSCTVELQAQNPLRIAENEGKLPRILLQEALDTALKNNLNIKNAKLLAVYNQKLKSTSMDIPQANLTADYGQINSVFVDNRIGLSQTFGFPVVYSRQKSVYDAMLKASMVNIALKEAELKKQVSEVFYQLILLAEKKKLLKETDSIYATFAEKAALRFAKGESNVLENTVAQLQRGQILTQLIQLQQEIEVKLLQFQLLLNSGEMRMPYQSNFKALTAVSTDTAQLNEHPRIQLLQQDLNITRANTALLKSKLLPNVTLGFNTMSMKGTGADNVLYSSRPRFNSLQMGLSVPLFYGSQTAKVRASEISENMVKADLNMGLQNLKSELAMAFSKYNSKLTVFKYFDEVAVKNAQAMQKAANEQFTAGEINYLEWTMIVNQATTVRSNYYDAFNELSQSIIELNYLNTK